MAEVLRTGEDGTDFSHTLCPASLKKRERERKKSTFRKVSARILDNQDIWTKPGPSLVFCPWGDCLDPCNFSQVSFYLPCKLYTLYQQKDYPSREDSSITSLTSHHLCLPFSFSRLISCLSGPEV